MWKTMMLAALLPLLACNDNDENEDLTHDVNHKGSVESTLEVRDLDSTHRLLVTRHKVWVHDTVYRTLEYTDTLPALGLEHTIAENSDGDQQKVTVNKDYELYITVK
ncbi:MAG: hypothetical protein EOP50_13385 [Sphingobacteriales bacterium]|nr:MAG: hypothetical protein EOP50_13385 [Sphingobacteriales bacterium]